MALVLVGLAVVGIMVIVGGAVNDNFSNLSNSFANPNSGTSYLSGSASPTATVTPTATPNPLAPVVTGLNFETNSQCSGDNEPWITGFTVNGSHLTGATDINFGTVQIAYTWTSSLGDTDTSLAQYHLAGWPSATGSSFNVTVTTSYGTSQTGPANLITSGPPLFGATQSGGIGTNNLWVAGDGQFEIWGSGFKDVTSVQVNGTALSFSTANTVPAGDWSFNPNHVGSGNEGENGCGQDSLAFNPLSGTSGTVTVNSPEGSISESFNQ